MPVQVRRIRSGEGRLLRDIRLAALADSPTAFESTLAGESARPDEAWEADAETRSEGSSSVNYIAENDDGVIGLVGAYRNEDEPGTVELVSMWVAPHGRGHGVGGQLIDRVTEWAKAAGATRVALWVTSGNEPAVALYARAGFIPTAVTKRHESHPCYEELRMARELADVSHD